MFKAIAAVTVIVGVRILFAAHRRKLDKEYADWHKSFPQNEAEGRTVHDSMTAARVHGEYQSGFTQLRVIQIVVTLFATIFTLVVVP